MLALVVKSGLDMLGISNRVNRVAFTGIMVVQSNHVMTTILMMHDEMDSVLSKFALEQTSQEGVDAMRIGLVVLAFEQSMSNHPLSEGKVLHSIFRIFFFVNNICQRDTINARDDRKIVGKSLAPLGPLALILELAGISCLGVHID